MTVTTAPSRFSPPPDSDAAEPPEHRGLPRDHVRLLVADRDTVRHGRFHHLADVLDPGDLVVLNTSPTLPAALDAADARGGWVTVHVSTVLDDGRWVVEVRRPDGRGPDLDRPDGEPLALPAGALLVLGPGYPVPGRRSRLRTATVTPPTAATGYLADHGRPITYGYVRRRFPLADYRTVYATEPSWGPGSAEMPSAGRPFTASLLTRLVARGVAVAPVELHCGVSNPELHEPPAPERYSVPESTARAVRSASEAGRRVVAVGTTVVRALETTTGEDGVTRAGRGWTDLVLSPERPAQAVTGLVTGLHAPGASHLLLLEAVAGPDLVDRAYAEAVAERYLWHEFGDSMLFLP